MTSKRKRPSPVTGEDKVLPVSKRAQTESLARFSALPDEILIRILHNLPIDTLVRCQTISHRFYILGKDSELWKSLFYDRFVLPRALRIPGMRLAPPTDAFYFSSRKSKWLRDTPLVNRIDGKTTDWKSQYRLRHNWAIGACEMQEIHVADKASVPGMLVKLAEGVVVTADIINGLRSWNLKERSLITRCDLGGVVPTCLALGEQNANEYLGIAIGFQDGSWGIWRLYIPKKSFKEIYRHPASTSGTLSAVAYANSYVLTITNSQLLSLYASVPTVLKGESGDGDLGNPSAEKISSETEGDLAPRLLASLKSYTSWPPLSLSIRTTKSTIIASIAYSLPTYCSGYTIGLQELHISRSSGEATFSRLASALPQGFSSVLSSPGTSSPTSGTTTPLPYPIPVNCSRPTSLSYSHPYILATHPDNTLTLYLCNSTASSLTISPGTKLWGHTSSILAAEITPRGKAVSVSTRGNELRVWELEGGLPAASRKYTSTSSNARLSERSVQIRTEDKEAIRTELERERWHVEEEASKRWVGFDDEMVIVLKEDGRGSQALMVYDFT